jgi:DNA (cytosine-5)-methyltransferase 1
VVENEFDSIPDHDLLVGGFPCQDYSVARTLKQASGIKGKKGVLWWAIHSILEKKGEDAPKYLMLENVDRLLKSPTSQRGRDFAIMLASLSDLNYIVEWRVINSAEYGMPQRRKRVYIMAYKKGSPIYEKICNLSSPQDWVKDIGVMQKAFPTSEKSSLSNSFKIKGWLEDISDNLVDYNSVNRPFGSAGIVVDREVFTYNPDPHYNGPSVVLKDILQDEDCVSEELFISKEALPKWEYLKGAKKEKRTSSSGHSYNYSEGPVTFPDNLNKPSRTIITGEGGKGASRFKHVVESKSGKLRRLTPIELERLNMFPDNHTIGASDSKRAFFMGNALVVGVVSNLGRELANELKALG